VEAVREDITMSIKVGDKVRFRTKFLEKMEAKDLANKIFEIADINEAYFTFREHGREMRYTDRTSDLNKIFMPYTEMGIRFIYKRRASAFKPR
jgi:hypothetical protein